MQAYLFVHFREKSSPDGEQVYFSVSRDGYCWEEIHGGRPVIWCTKGEKGARDFTIIRERKSGKYYILGTDLSLVYNFSGKYHNSWEAVASQGSKYLSLWESKDLVEWSEQRLISICNEEYGCIWAPDIIYDRKRDDYVLHWSSTHKSSDYKDKGIYYCRTKDFKNFTKSAPLYCPENKNYIDSAIYEENGKYYMFVKSENLEETILMLQSDEITGPYERCPEFDECVNGLERGMFEAPTAVKLENGSWNLFLDYYGSKENIKGYIPFSGMSLHDSKFVRKDADFTFPYRFKHGTILNITLEEYKRIKNHKWSTERK